jgi:SAM-dependent methyltransferase
MAQDTPHSAEYFGDTRDFWWNADFLKLMAQRWGLMAAPDILDVGCGVGHWGRTLLSLVSPAARLWGVDREPRWVAQAAATAAQRGLGPQVTYAVGLAEALDFPSERFDVVTCQTLLIHVKEPEAVLRGMLRVLKPGGLLVVAEPQNLTNALLLGRARFHQDADTVLTQVRLQLLCERGKEALGEGNNSIGELVPGMFQRLGLQQLAVYQSDRASAFLPPYTDPSAAAQKAELLAFAARDFWNWDKEDTQRFFLAGGGTQQEFDAAWATVRATALEVAQAVRAGTEEQVGSGAFFLVSGRRAS